MDEPINMEGMTPIPSRPMFNDAETLGLALAVGRSFLGLKDLETQLQHMNEELRHARITINQRNEDNQALQEQLDQANARIADLEMSWPQDSPDSMPA